MTKKQYLKNVRLFSELYDEDIAKVADIAVEKSYKKGEVIFHEDDLGSTLFILKSGAVKISICGRNGREDILKIIYPGDYFGDMSMLDGKYRSATVTALEKTASLIMQREHFLTLINRHPHLAMNMLATMCRRLRNTDEKIASLRFADAYGKVARVLLDMAAEHGLREGERIIVKLNLSRQEFADLAGLTRETTARILAELRQNGCIKLEKRTVVILNEAVLRRELL